MLLVEGNKATLLGSTKARLFTRSVHWEPDSAPVSTVTNSCAHMMMIAVCFRGKLSVEYDPGSDLSFLLTDSD